MVDIAEFQNYMDQGHNAAWDGDWAEAINAYSRAVQARPEDPEAHVNLGLALLNDGQLSRALKVYKRATKLSPDDPLPLERSADVLERMGQLKEAAEQYVKVSEVYLSMRDLDKAIGNWERATQLTPGLISVHARLAQAYERVGDRQNSIREYLTLAYNFRRIDDVPKAIRAVERALRLDKNNSQALNALRALKSGGEVVLPDDIINRSLPEREPEHKGHRAFQNATPDVGEADPKGPVGEAMTMALEMLAAYVVESGLNNYIMPAMQGMEFQRQNNLEQAISAYQQAARDGLNHPALQMLLGALMLDHQQYSEARAHFREVLGTSELEAGAMHGLGQATHQLDDYTQATRFLVQSLQSVDTSLAVDANEIDELNQVYDNLLVALEGRTPDALKIINERFIGLLSGNDWKQRIAETRRHLDETLRDEGGQGVIDFLVAKGTGDLGELVSMIDRFIRMGLYTLAMDESHRAVEKSPFYLPIHVRMAEVMMKEGRIRQAINKYNTVARAYMVREENDRAAGILGEVLEKAPLDVDVRISLIELLEDEDRWAEALDQYIDLAETYQQLGDFDRANETFGASERLARRIEAPPEKLVSIKHSLADISQMRLNTRQALRIYEDILAIKPDDERALRTLVELNYTQNNPVEAVRNLDKLLGFYAKSNQVNKIISLLEELVSTNQNDLAVRQRLASMYRRLNQKSKAIEQLDALGELQLDAGLHREAAQTIRQIISMNPDRVEDYKRLLSQLGV